MLDILFLAITAFLIYRRLNQVLGDTNYDNERGPRKTHDYFSAFKTQSADNNITQIEIASGLEAGLNEEQQEILNAVRKKDPSFELAKFSKNAKKAFAFIVDKFASGDKSSLKELLSPEIYTMFCEEIDAIKSRMQIKEVQITSLQELLIEDITRDGLQIIITVKIVSQQIETIKDSVSNQLISKSNAEEITDVWSFARPLNSTSSVWKLVAVE